MSVRGGKHLFALLLFVLLVAKCGQVPVKQFYVLNYTPSLIRERLNPGPFPWTIRLRPFEIEEAYSRPQIVYRQSPFQLRFYYYRLWAIKPERIITDLFHKHLLTANLVRNVVRKFDEGHKPDFEIQGVVEAIEEYDSDELWFAHVAMRINLIRIKDGRIMYSHRYDHRKRVFQHEPEYVVREMSSLVEYIFTQAIHDMDIAFASEYNEPKQLDTLGTSPSGLIPTTIVDSTVFEEQP